MPTEELKKDDIKNALNIDVDDLVISFLQFRGKNWKDLDYSPTVFQELEYVLNLLNEISLKATFFFPGWIAQKRPDLVKRTSDDNHEIGSHSLDHKEISSSSRKVFRKELETSLDILGNIVGKPVKIFKAPNWSITERSLWAYDVMKELGVEIDCSAKPCVKKALGFKGYHNIPFRLDNGLLLIPPTSYRFYFVDLLVTGGGWCSIAELLGKRKPIIDIYKNLNRANVPFLFYFHPFEIRSFADLRAVSQYDLRGYLYGKLSANRLKDFFLHVKGEFKMTTISDAFSKHLEA